MPLPLRARELLGLAALTLGLTVTVPWEISWARDRFEQRIDRIASRMVEEADRVPTSDWQTYTARCESSEGLVRLTYDVFPSGFASLGIGLQGEDGERRMLRLHRGAPGQQLPAGNWNVIGYPYSSIGWEHSEAYALAESCIAPSVRRVRSDPSSHL